MGRLFDTVAALLGFTREVTFEAQAALWLEHIASVALQSRDYEMPLRHGAFDYYPLLHAIAWERARGVDRGEIARGFHRAIVRTILEAVWDYPRRQPVVCSGGVFANRLLCGELRSALGERMWLNAVVPANDGGICLGQAALAALRS